MPAPAPAVEKGIVRKHSAYARHNCAVSAPKAVNMLSGLFSGYPAGSTGDRGDFSVQRHGVFHHHIGQARGDVVEKHGIERIALLPEKVLLHPKPLFPQKSRAPARHLRVRIPGADHHPGQVLFQDDLRAGRRSALMAARLQGHIYGPPRRVLGAGGQSVSLRMQFAAAPVIALSDNAPVLYDHRAHHGVGVGPALPQSGKTYGPAHIVHIRH